MHDIRQAFRAMKAAPVVSAVAILSLALGIGANTAMFSILDSLLLRTLPVREPQRLATIGQANGVRTSWTNPIWEAIRDRPELFDGAFAWSSTRFNLSRTGPTEFVDGLWASGRYFDGRLFGNVGVRLDKGYRLTTNPWQQANRGPDGEAIPSGKYQHHPERFTLDPALADMSEVTESYGVTYALTRNVNAYVVLAESFRQANGAAVDFTGEAIGQQGRRAFVRTTLYDARGGVLALARATWVAR